MKKLTLTALAAMAVAGTAFAGPTTVVSKEYKQPCVTPCFRDTEFQLDLFYSYNDASHQGSDSVTDRFLFGPQLTPIDPLTFVETGIPGITQLIPSSTVLIQNTSVIPAGSSVIRERTATISQSPYFRDGSGGGVGLNYFFARYVGIGVEGNWWDGVNTGFSGDFATRDFVSLSAPVDPVALLLAAKAANTSVRFVDPAHLVLTTRKSFGNDNRRSHREAANQVTGSLILRYPFEGPICWAPYIFGGGGGVFDGDSTGFGHIGLGVEFRITPYMGFFTDWRWEFMSGHHDNGDDFRDRRDIRALDRLIGIVNTHNLEDFEGHKRNDVSMTRVGVRFVF